MRYLTELETTRPDTVPRYAAALPGAQATVLGRLWGALAREPLPGLRSRTSDSSCLTVTFDNGHHVTGPDAAGIIACDLPELTLDGRDVTDPATLVRCLWPGPDGDRLATEVSGSVDGLALARAHAPSGAGTTRDSTWYEQSVIDGHPVHPCSRSRPGMSVAEVLAYAPEHRPEFELPLVAVARERMHTPAPDWPLTDGPRILLPVHPWQHDHILPRYGLIAAGSIPARPLMSLRSVATEQWQIKMSIDVQLTSAVRGLSHPTMHNGPALSRVLPDLPGLTFLRETHAAGIDPHLGAVLRQPPERHLRAGQVAVPLSALTTSTTPGIDFATVITATVPPLLRMLDRGIALEAHGQNTLLVLDENQQPHGLLYRDVGGIHLSPHRFGIHPPLRGTIVNDDPLVLHSKLAAAMTMTLAGLIHAADDDSLWAYAAHTIDTTYADLPADHWNRHHHALFHAPTLPVKAYTTKRLADDPRTDLWCRTPNPYTAHR
ncbi:IucA/IucC family protein [Streptomyces sp. NPDC091377]|uniref:IucA/IucC family protein n=1 Tax=Streptomyces sp. NPDC091377 TaxID=3365995 RepID=UPI003814D5C2